MYYDTTAATDDYRAQITIVRSAFDDVTSTAANFVSEVRVRFERWVEPFDRVRSVWEDFDRQEIRRRQELMSWRARASVPSIPPGLLNMCAMPPSTIRPRPALEPAPVWCGRRTRRADRKHVPTRGRHKPRVWERDA